MTDEEKKELIERYRSGTDEAEASVKGLPPEALDFVPAIEGAWTIRAQVAHLLDADMFGWGRIRKAVAQPGTCVEVWDQGAWESRLDYARADVARTLYQCRIVREAVADFLETIIPEDWGTLGIKHPERGAIGLAALVAQYADHTGYHIELIERNMKAYRGL
jgi:hypothetical protein